VRACREDSYSLFEADCQHQPHQLVRAPRQNPPRYRCASPRTPRRFCVHPTSLHHRPPHQEILATPGQRQEVYTHPTHKHTHTHMNTNIYTHTHTCAHTHTHTHTHTKSNRFGNEVTSFTLHTHGLHLPALNSAHTSTLYSTCSSPVKMYKNLFSSSTGGHGGTLRFFSAALLPSAPDAQSRLDMLAHSGRRTANILFKQTRFTCLPCSPCSGGIGCKQIGRAQCICNQS